MSDTLYLNANLLGGKHTSRVTEDETTHRHDNTEHERPPCQVLDRAIVDNAIVLLSNRV